MNIMTYEIELEIFEEIETLTNRKLRIPTVSRRRESSIPNGLIQMDN